MRRPQYASCHPELPHSHASCRRAASACGRHEPIRVRRATESSRSGARDQRAIPAILSPRFRESFSRVLQVIEKTCLASGNSPYTRSLAAAMCRR